MLGYLSADSFPRAKLEENCELRIFAHVTRLDQSRASENIRWIIKSISCKNKIARIQFWLKSLRRPSSVLMQKALLTARLCLFSLR